MAMERTLAALLAAETEARGIVEKAEKEARELREQTQQKTQEIIRTAEQQEEQETQQAMEEARRQVMLTKNKISDRSEKTAQNWEELFQKNYNTVVEFIMSRILDT
jgi:vacuolar-type H+-ATPase subunit H